MEAVISLKNTQTRGDWRLSGQLMDNNKKSPGLAAGDTRREEDQLLPGSLSLQSRVHAARAVLAKTVVRVTCCSGVGGRLNPARSF